LTPSRASVSPLEISAALPNNEVVLGGTCQLILPLLSGAFMPDSMKARVASLSPRQRQIVRLTSLGCTSHEIANILGMSRWTVENHQFQAKERLGVSKAAVLTRIAIKFKISPLDDVLSRTEERKLARKTARK
jgi:DNA-binding CsgD family transcriptional regulator